MKRIRDIKIVALENPREGSQTSPPSMRVSTIVDDYFMHERISSNELGGGGGTDDTDSNVSSRSSECRDNRCCEEDIPEESLRYENDILQTVAPLRLLLDREQEDAVPCETRLLTARTPRRYPAP
jgi:hypothetical protein